MATKTLTPSACPVTGNNPAGMPTLAPSADVCSSGGGGGTDFLVAGPIRSDGSYDATVGDGSTVDMFALVGARDGNTIVKQQTSPGTAQTGGGPPGEANWHIDGIGIADTAVFVGVTTPTIAATALEAQGGGDVVAFFKSNLNAPVSAAHSTVVIRKSFDSGGGVDEPSELQIQDTFGNYYIRASIGRGSFLKIRPPKADRFEDLILATDFGDDVIFAISATGALQLSGSNIGTTGAVFGQVQLSGGTATVSTVNVGTPSKVFLTYASGFTNSGTLKVGTLSPGSFVINSSNGSDANFVNWFVLNTG